MGAYLKQLDALAPDARWPQVRQWLFAEPQPFFAELRAKKPILVLPELTLATRFDDCATVLRNHQIFQVDLYKPKQSVYWMAQDETPQHIREKSIMQALLDREQVPAMRSFIAQAAAERLAAGRGGIDATHGLARAVAIDMVQQWFGFEDSDPAALYQWSYWSQQDAFHNQPFDNRADAADVIANRAAASAAMGKYLAGLVGRKAAEVKAGQGGDKPVARLLRLQFSGALSPDFDMLRLVLNIGGLLIGSVETTNHTVVNALAELLSRADVLARARAAAVDEDPAKIDGFVFEALRFRPAFPYYFRTCHVPTTLSAGTTHAHRVEPGTTVLAVTYSAMHDDHRFVRPEVFDETRDMGDTFTFGQGMHECLGKTIGQALVAETVRQVLRLPEVRAAGPIVWQGDAPEHWPLQWAA